MFLLVKRRIHIVDILLAEFILRQAQAFSEPLEVYDLTRTQEFDDIVDIRIITQTQDVVIGNACLLLCCIAIKTTDQKLQ